ncbi:hypothetical protein PaecuDRAFT_3561 [Paenibacillus curdlanolyticus YK9]|uniref:Uncharacterized protein n=1 Tax=Paenibacillus curdlanolyticus YK9 TaxID=717606 RepID=E0ID59_9BACL|nr:hypothetical protein [Paenibacillus curdlanolyticus]EFM09514.1 hypothetical protein PaecuDRAFT_3561 [Paenibacillus curdlanolyticus YK9]
MKLTRTKLWILLVIVALLAGFVLCANQYTSKRDALEQALNDKVDNAVNAVQHSAVERVKVEDPSNPYFVVNMNHGDIQSLVMKELLEELNNDSSVPPIKLTHYQITQTKDIDVYADVKYTTVFGMTKTISAHLTAPVIRFKHETGDEILK